MQHRGHRVRLGGPAWEVDPERVSSSPWQLEGHPQATYLVWHTPPQGSLSQFSKRSKRNHSLRTGRAPPAGRLACGALQRLRMHDARYR